MSAFTTYDNTVAAWRSDERVRAIQRSRRVEAGSVSEMARSLLREARESQDIQLHPAGESLAGCGRAGVARLGAATARRRRPSGLYTRVTTRPLAARRA
jgi:hypothetical protein